MPDEKLEALERPFVRLSGKEDFILFYFKIFRICNNQYS